MTIAMTTRQGNGSIDCGGAEVRAHCRHLATVVTIRGEIDAVNVDRVRDCLRRFIVGDTPVVLDISDVSHFAGAGFSLLYTFDEDCRGAGMEWTLVARPDVTEQLVAADGDSAFLTAGSVPEAFGDLADAVVYRRRLALPLIRKTA
ncbi:STAS domain-containing protein [Mycobacterium montefiorense]|uniref:STAS domain-containing protein n=1 Tax=Mycobacterium montefiorense TaxID=154654 RepID=UPI0021F2F385|nr:STAS domain-containing protein [Mycobacterium montefiorense]MCV7428862.1 STAS domain-containing protein [Mycobacterium montefiorense]